MKKTERPSVSSSPARFQVWEVLGFNEVGAVAILLEHPGSKGCLAAAMTLSDELATPEDLVVPPGVIPGGEWTIHMSTRHVVPLWSLTTPLWDLSTTVEMSVLFAMTGGKEGALHPLTLGKADEDIRLKAYSFQLEVSNL